MFWLLWIAAAAAGNEVDTSKQLLESAFVAKQNLALSNVLDFKTKLKESLAFDLQSADLDSEILNKMERHVFADEIYSPIYSIKPYVQGKRAKTMTVDANLELAQVCNTSNKLRAAELILYYNAHADRHCLGLSTTELLKLHLQLHPTSVEAKLLLSVLENDYPSLLKLAWFTNHPVAHLVLAQMFLREQRDVERAAIHLLQSALAVSHMVLDVYNGASPGQHVHLSHLETQPELAASVAIVSSVEEYEQYQSHLVEMVHEYPEYSFHLGDLYSTGLPELGIEANLPKAMEMYETAMNTLVDGDYIGLSASRLASLLVEIGENNATAFELFQRAHALGEPSALLGLAVFYRDGGGGVVPRNTTKALELFLLASEAGYSDGDYQASKLLMMMSNSDADKHLLRAAEAGHVMACIDYAQLLLNELKFEQAVPWLLRAVRTDWTDFLPYDSKQALAQYVKGNYEASLNIYQLAARILWQPEAMINAAYLLERSHNRKLAFDLYSIAAKESKIGEAYRKLGECHAEWPDICTPSDVNQAAYWYRMGAEHGDAESAWQLGVYRMRGNVHGLVQSRQAMELDFARAIELDPNAYWVVLATRVVDFVQRLLFE